MRGDRGEGEGRELTSTFPFAVLRQMLATVTKPMSLPANKLRTSNGQIYGMKIVRQ